MKLTCPNCSARYEVNLPGLTGREVRVKCVKCNTKFLVNSVETPLSDPRKPEPAQVGASLGSEETHAAVENKPPAAPSRKQPEPARSEVSDEAPAMPEVASSQDEETTEAKSDPLPSLALGAEAGEPVTAPLETHEADETRPGHETGETGEFTGDSVFGDDIETLDFDQEAPELEPAVAEETTGKDDLDDLLDQILEGKLSDTRPAPASSSPPAAMDDPLYQDEDGQEDLTAKPLFPGEQEREMKSFSDDSAATSSSGEMPFLDNQESEGKSEVDRWAEAFAAEGLDHSMEEDLGALDLPGEFKETCAFEEQKTPAPFNEDEAREIADEMAILNQKNKPTQNKDEAETAGARPEPGAILARKKKGLSLPATRGGKTVLYGLLLALGLAAGGGYMLRETLLPGELLNFRSAAAPDARAHQAGKVHVVRNKPVAAKAPVATAALPPQAPETAGGEPPADKAVKSKPAENAAGEQQLEPTQAAEPVPEVVKELAALADSHGNEAPAEEPSEGLAAALSPRRNAVTLSTIMPVAYSASEIRILSFNLVMELTDEESADAVRQALPVFENATVTTVDTMFENKFFNDILYVKEKLRTNLKTAYNDIIVGGRVKRVSFKDFLIQ